MDETRYKRISSSENPGLRALKKLAQESRIQRQQGRALLEGVHLVTAYRDKLGPPLRLVVSEHGVQQAEIRAVLASLPDVDCWLLRDQLFAQLSELRTPPGLLAEIAIPQPAPAAALPNHSCVLLDRVQDAGNVGSILRTAAAAGVKDIFLGPGCAAAWSARVVRAAQGAHFDLAIHEHVDLAQVMQHFAGSCLAAAAHGAQSLYALKLEQPIAWLFGSEGQGIDPQLEQQADERVLIPLAAGCESLNVAAAAAICLFEERRQKTAGPGNADAA